jgi:hypothetical protein
MDDELASKAASYKHDAAKIYKVQSDHAPDATELGTLKTLSAAALSESQTGAKFAIDARKTAYQKKAMLLQTGRK